jgi:hypothetical protein
LSCGNPACEWLAVVTEVSPAWDLRPVDTYPASHRFAPITGLGRVRHEPEHIAYGILYLASDEAKFVTGSELCDRRWVHRPLTMILTVFVCLMAATACASALTQLSAQFMTAVLSRRFIVKA